MVTDLEKKIANAVHQSKPDAENAVVVYDRNGRWIFEIYTAGHEVIKNDRINQEKL
jgi:hypothetical protein